MWQLRNTPQALHLPIASEACFSIKEYVDKIKTRFTLFSQLPLVDSITRKMSSFVDDNLLRFFNKLVSQVESSGAIFTNFLNPSHRTLSPSDHGFHNAIRGNDGNLYFIDFEYAGWDDPVKMICDCFLQPDKPVPEKFHSLFLKNCKQVMDPMEHFVNRIKYIYPLLGIKWCLIMLNEFLPASESRRQFAGKSVGNDLRIFQLERSKNSFNRIHEQFNDNYIVHMIRNSA
jgi:thiamine kinase-like enzyme